MNTPSRKPLKTYSHLLASRRVPTRYEIATSRLLYYPERGGFEVEPPLSAWYATYQRNSPLVAENWEAFADPRATTYTDYTRRRAEAESFLDSLLRSMENEGDRPDLGADWLALLETTLAPLRFAFHGLQMASAYVGSMAPASRIVIASAMQAADEVRRIQRLAQRWSALRAVSPAFGRDARERWQADPIFQPLRRGIETLLVTFDWGEALVALGFCLKPRIDSLLMREVARLAAKHEPLFAPFLQSLHEDCLWHHEWTQALLGVATAQRPEAGIVIRGWCEKWDPLARLAIESFAPRWAALSATLEFEACVAGIESDRLLARIALTERRG